MMQQAFQEMTLLDYAINAALVLSYVTINKQDKAGLVTFADQFGTFVAPSKQEGQMQTIQEALYAEQTQFGETDYSALLAGLSRHYLVYLNGIYASPVAVFAPAKHASSPVGGILRGRRAISVHSSSFAVHNRL